MRRLASPALLLAVLSIASSAYAAPFESYEDRTGLPIDKYRDVTLEIQSLEEHLRSNVSCGGWINDSEQESMERFVVSEAFGAPGRSPLGGDAFTNMPGGASARDPFVYPSEAYGYMSACSIYDGQYNPDQLCMIGPENATPQMCKDLYDNLSEMKKEPGPVHICGDPALPHVVFIRKRCFDFTQPCTGEECRCGTSLTVRDYGTPVGNVQIVDRGPVREERKLMPDPIEDECRPRFEEYFPGCHYLVSGEGVYTLILDEPMRYEVDIPSFYRHYGPINSHDTIPEEAPQKGMTVQSEGMEQKVSAECYEYYIEKDAMTKVAPPWNNRCELYETDDSDSDKDSPEWSDGNFPQKTSIEPNRGQSPYTDAEMNPERARRKQLFPWVPDEETSLTLLDIYGEYHDEPLDDSDDLSAYFNAAPESTIIAAQARQAGLADAFDDATNPGVETVYPGTDELEHRIFSRWWNAQQEKLREISRIPSMHLILPARYGVGLDTGDPILQYATKVVDRPEGVIEVELRAGRDVFGSVIASLQHSLVLTPKEIKIPVIVPVASETEINVLIHDWRQWGIANQREGEAEAFVERLTTYRDQIRNVRLLRGAVASYLTGVLGLQREIRGFFAQWYLENATALESYASDTAHRDAVLAKWRDVMREFIRMHDTCELKWCSNARYTLPIYSLLDPWLPGRPALHQLLSDPAFSLEDIEWDRLPDVVADFSELKLPAREFYLPALEVTQVRINLPLPPSGIADLPPIEAFPDIPMIDPALLVPESAIFAEYEPPEVTLPELDERHYVPQSPQSGNFEEVFARLVNMETMVGSAAHNYCEFVNSVAGRNDQPRKIRHTEFDLRERITRLFARRAPLWRQDYQGREERVGSPAAACTDDVICDKLHPEETKSFEWQINAPSDSASTIMPANRLLREQTMPADEASNPFAAPLEALKRYLFPETEPPVPENPVLQIRLAPGASEDDSSREQ